MVIKFNREVLVCFSIFFVIKNITIYTVSNNKKCYICIYKQ